jgi:chromosome segregation ATPase
MRIVLIVSGVLLVIALAGLLHALGGANEIVRIVLGWPLGQQLAVAALAVVLLALLIMAIWQSGIIDRQGKAIIILQSRMKGLRDAITGTAEEQEGADAAVRHLVGTDPVVIIDDVQKRLLDAEARTTDQAAQNDAVDLQSRIDEIRRRQQALRTLLGTVSEKRRVIEPMLGEVKERQGLIERALGELEKDETGKTLDERLKETEGFLNRGYTRLETLESIFNKFEQLRANLQQLQNDTTPFRSPEKGIVARYTEVGELQKALDVTLLSLEKQEEEAIGDRLERLAKRKAELEQRIAALNESFGSLEAIRQDIAEHFQKLHASIGSHVKQ